MRNDDVQQESRYPLTEGVTPDVRHSDHFLADQWVDEVHVAVELPMGPPGPEGPPPTFEMDQVFTTLPGRDAQVILHQGQHGETPPGDGIWRFDMTIPQGPPGVDGEPGPPLNIQGDLGSAGPPPTDGTAPGDAWIGDDGVLWVWACAPDGTCEWTAMGFQGPPGRPGTAYVGIEPPTGATEEGELWFNPEAVAYAPLGMRVDDGLQLGPSGGSLWGNDNGELVLGTGTTENSIEQARLSASGLTVTTLNVGATTALSVDAATGRTALGTAGRTTVVKGKLETPTPTSDPEAANKKYVDDSIDGMIDQIKSDIFAQLRPRWSFPGTPVGLSVASVTPQTCCSLTIKPPAGTTKHIVYVTAAVMFAGAAGSSWETTILMGGTSGAKARSEGSGGYMQLTCSQVKEYTHNGADMTFEIQIHRSTGSGTARTYGDHRFNNLSVLAIPVG